MKSLFLKVCIVILCSVLPTSSFAAMEFHPYLVFEEEYNDNIDQTENNEEEDWITTVQPGISMTYENRSVDAVADYSLRYRFYKENDEDNLDEFEDVQQANASALFFGGRPFTLRVSEVISRETLNERDDNEFSEENRTTAYHLTVTPEYDLRLTPTLSLVFGYDYDRFDYTDSAGNGSEEHRGRLSAVKVLSASSEVFARYQYSTLSSEDDEDFDRMDYTLGLSAQVGARTTLDLEGGYSDVEYDTGEETDSTNWQAEVGYRLSEALNAQLSYRQDFTLSIDDGLTKSRETALNLLYQKESTSASAGLFWNSSDYVRENRDDEAVGIRCDLSRSLANNLTFDVDAEYERAAFDDAVSDEDVDRLTAGMAFSYLYRRLTASLGYRYRLNDSDINANDYTNNIITLSASVRF